MHFLFKSYIVLLKYNSESKTLVTMYLYDLSVVISSPKVFVKQLQWPENLHTYILQFLTLSAGGALTTALMFVELNQTGNGSDNISLHKNTFNLFFED